jgi:hypothetical protein
MKDCLGQIIRSGHLELPVSMYDVEATQRQFIIHVEQGEDCCKQLSMPKPNTGVKLT